ncbi:MAG: hypothetical protein RJB13_1894 [Pseudomonadota bacterium]|jgi:hypothetical protein
MKIRSKVTIIATATICALFSTSCSNESNYSAGNKVTPLTKEGVVAAEQADATAKSDSSGEFFKKGQSLDLYIVMDKSGSLWEYRSNDDKKFPGSDPQCLRLLALVDLIEKLGAELNNGEEVRLNVVTFGSFATNVGSIRNPASMGRENLASVLKDDICSKPNKENRDTIYSKALEKISLTLSEQRKVEKMDVETAIFFSDGAARDENTDDLKNAIAEFNSAFPNRAYGVLLGNTEDKCKITNAAGQELTTTECITEVVGGDPNRVVQSANAAKLSETMIQLLSK